LTEYVLHVGSDVLKKCLPKYLIGRDRIKDLGAGIDVILMHCGACTET
jgi:hypothetical protein